MNKITAFLGAAGGALAAAAIIKALGRQSGTPRGRLISSLPKSEIAWSLENEASAPATAPATAAAPMMVGGAQAQNVFGVEPPVVKKRKKKEPEPAGMPFVTGYQKGQDVRSMFRKPGSG